METQQQRLPWVLVGVLGLILAAGLIWFLILRPEGSMEPSEGMPEATQDAPGLSDEEADRITKEVQELLLLPALEEERPLVARIDRADALVQDQAFYQHVQNGDYLLIYASLSKAIIYRPQDHLLVNVGPIEIDPPAAEPVAEAPVVEPIEAEPETSL